MAIVRWEPFREIESLQQKMNRLFETLVPRRGDSMIGMGFMPPAEMSETEEAVHLKVEIPGMKPEDLDIKVAREAVIIRGERQEEMQTEENCQSQRCKLNNQLSRVERLRIARPDSVISMFFKEI